MTIIGVTGHQHLPPEAQDQAERDIRDLLSRQADPVTGMTSLADGADQLFARLVLDAGGDLHVVIPARLYATTMTGDALEAYHQLRAAAVTVTELDHEQPTEQAFYDAGVLIAERCELLVAVWDGQPARSLGGTADVVTRARELDRSVLISWPPGLRRA